MVEDDYPEGTFFHYLSDEELSVQFGDGKLFLTYFTGQGKARAKRVLDLKTASPQDVHDLLRDYLKADNDGQ